MTNGTIDGLGYEEIGQAGSQVSNVWVTGSVVAESMISGLNLYAAGSLIVPLANITTISGTTSSFNTHSGAQVTATNISGITTVRGATITATTLNATTASGTTASFATISGIGVVATNVSGITGVQATTLNATTASGTTLSYSVISGANAIVAGSVTASSRMLSAGGTGSPTTWGQLVQAGSAVTGAGSQVWVVYGTAFSAVPQVAASSHGDTPTIISRVVGSDAAGSAFFTSSAAAIQFTWLAVGPA